MDTQNFNELSIMVKKVKLMTKTLYSPPESRSI